MENAIPELWPVPLDWDCSIYVKIETKNKQYNWCHSENVAANKRNSNEHWMTDNWLKVKLIARTWMHWKQFFVRCLVQCRCAISPANQRQKRKWKQKKTPNEQKKTIQEPNKSIEIKSVDRGRTHAIIWTIAQFNLSTESHAQCRPELHNAFGAVLPLLALCNFFGSLDRLRS